MITIAQYHAALRAGPCIVSCMRTETLHHVRGGSITERIGLIGRGKASDWLVLPLAHKYHQGDQGIHHMGFLRWEDIYGRQADLIDQLAAMYGLPLWDLAEMDRAANRRKKRVLKKIVERTGYRR